MYKKLLLLITSIVSCFVFFSSKVEAKEEINHVNANNLDEIVGSIYLYDDYSVVVYYKYRLKDLSLKVCVKDECSELASIGQTYLNSEPYTEMGVWSKSFSEYIVSGEDKNTYTITVSGSFKLGAETVVSTSVGLTNDFVTDPIVDDKNNKEDEIMTSLEKVIKVVNIWVIPILYILLASWLIVKGILLAIDLVKHSDDPSVRREKIKAYAFLALAILLAGALNTGVAFLTGLFG